MIFIKIKKKVVLSLKFYKQERLLYFFVQIIRFSILGANCIILLSYSLILFWNSIDCLKKIRRSLWWLCLYFDLSIRIEGLLIKLSSFIKDISSLIHSIRRLTVIRGTMLNLNLEFFFFNLAIPLKWFITKVNNKGISSPSIY